MSDIGGLQLLPNKKKRFNFGSFGGTNRLLVIAVVVLLALGSAVVVLNMMTSSAMSSIEEIDAELSIVYEARSKTEEEKILSFQQQSAATKSLLQSHIVWVDGLRSVQGLIEPSVSFEILSADASKRTYSFNAVADSYSTVARQIASFYGSPAISNVALGSVTSSKNGKVEFTMDLTFKADHFLMRTAKANE